MSKSNNRKLILDYLAKENRPFNAQDIVTNLQSLGKTAVANALEELAAEKQIIGKVYGKQKVYMTLQMADCSNVKEELRKLDENIIYLRGDLYRMKEENVKIENHLEQYEIKVQIVDLKSNVALLKEEIAQINGKLNELKNLNVKVYSKEECNKVQKDLDKYVKEWRKFRRISNEMIGVIMENCNIKRKDLCEELGLLLDEDENVQPP